MIAINIVMKVVVGYCLTLSAAIVHLTTVRILRKRI